MLEGGPEVLRSLGRLDLPSENRPHSLGTYLDSQLDNQIIIYYLVTQQSLALTPTSPS
jgi:hypothetical protein